MNKYAKGCLLFILIFFLAISVVNATDVSEDTSDVMDNSIVEQDIQNTSTVIPNDNNFVNGDVQKISKTLKSDKKTSSNLTVNQNENSEELHKTIVFNAETFNQYVTNRNLNDNVSNGDTLDFQGMIFGERYALTINKPVNIISSTNDAFYGNDREIGFTINQDGSGTNLTNVHFYNTHVVTKNSL